MKTQKLENGQFDLQEDFIYCGVKYTCKSWGKSGTSSSTHIAIGMFNGELRTFKSSTRKQAKDMFKKMIRKHLKRMESLNN